MLDILKIYIIIYTYFWYYMKIKFLFIKFYKNMFLTIIYISFCKIKLIN